MLQEEKKQYDIGVMVGRFQIHDPHLEHKKLFDTVVSQHSKVIVFLGCNHTPGTIGNSLDYPTRKIMIEQLYGDKIAAILPLYDQEENSDWTKILDSRIREVFPSGSVVLYGSKDSFIPYYKKYGKFDTRELVPDNMVSATDIRKAVSNELGRTQDFRAGCIYTAAAIGPRVITQVEVAVLSDDCTQVLMVQERENGPWSFVKTRVGFENSNLESAVHTGVSQHLCCSVHDLKYLGSSEVYDWKTRGDKDIKVISVFFAARKFSGSIAVAMDRSNLLNSKWFEIKELKEEMVQDSHKEFIIKLKKSL